VSEPIPVLAALDLTGLPKSHSLRPVLQAALAARRGAEPGPFAGSPGALWDAAHFGLDRSALFRDVDAETQQGILERCGRGLLEEAFFIERAGLVYCAKMILLAETTDERMLYALFAGDEAVHLDRVARFLPDPPTELTAALHDILKDEARHHGSGLVLFNQAAPTAAIRDLIVEVLVRFLGMVQAGPQATVAAVDEALGGLSRARRVGLFEDLGAEDHARGRLGLLRTLMGKAEAAPIVHALEARGAFRPLRPEECA